MQAASLWLALPLASVVTVLCIMVKLLYSSKRYVKLLAVGSSKAPVRKPESVNYHFTRQCNYSCGFCFHTAKTSFVLPKDEAQRGLKMLKVAGRADLYYLQMNILFKKINCFL